MPFVQIFVSGSFEEARVRAISDGVQRALIATVDVPPDDRFQVVCRSEDTRLIWDRHFLGVERSDEAVFVHVTLSAGRDDVKKRALYRAIVENLSSTAQVRPADVLIVLSETTRVNWSFGNGEAQYAPDAVPA
jgi:phenylpyruvate tautomerase PptA (4-oxalocrotonate tautomerase family)